ncbi:MAG: hypothetical protein COC19_02965 [SAR86 cluster bacterium]|uniref:DUF4062 domain-containing protein n=1 Tax=SAR86 cluster bacterium TaxID=2030880 RepID=A0A2A4MQN9_9GAMM|nr:MAG: hypothetical protein COC19_02965 [SAR86 cluster bacterium]
MAKPRVFVSSTYYDLKHVRSSLDIFIESLGYESVLSEKGDIAYSPDVPLDESCYRDVSNADIFILIVGGRYGSESSGGDKKKSNEFYERYESVTKKEFEEAINKDIPTYVLVEQSVHSEYHTYLRNKEEENISYAHVDSVNIFKFIEEILSLPRNNPTQTFEKFSDIEIWLREQWAGLFRELLKRMSDQKKFTELSEQVEGLKDINNTLKTYLESVMRVVSPDESSKLIEVEDKRLIEKYRQERIRRNPLAEYLYRRYDIGEKDIISVLESSKSANDFSKKISEKIKLPEIKGQLTDLFEQNGQAPKDLNHMRRDLGLTIFRKSRKKSR